MALPHRNESRPLRGDNVGGVTMSAEKVYFLCKGAFILASLLFVPYASPDIVPLAWVGGASFALGLIWDWTLGGGK